MLGFPRLRKPKSLDISQENSSNNSTFSAMKFKVLHSLFLIRTILYESEPQMQEQAKNKLIFSSIQKFYNIKARQTNNFKTSRFTHRCIRL